LSTLLRLLKFALATIACYFVFGVAGDLSARALVTLGQGSAAVEWTLYGLGYVLAIACAVVAWRARSRGHPLSTFSRTALAGFAAFFCYQWVFGGAPDFSPFLLGPGFLVCIVSAIVVLRATPMETPTSSEPVDCIGEQARPADFGKL
jgi:hypothetical protein